MFQFDLQRFVGEPEGTDITDDNVSLAEPTPPESGYTLTDFLGAWASAIKTAIDSGGGS